MNNTNNTTWITEVLEPLVNLLTVTECIFCAEQNILLCDTCWYQLFEATLATCYVCSARSDDNKTCRECFKRRSRPTYVWSLVIYKGAAKRLVYKMKFDSRREIASFIALKLDELVPQINFEAITFVPSSNQRIRQRGYDHAKLIAKKFASLRQLQLMALLKRIDNTRQLGKNKSDRQRQAAVAYDILPKIPKLRHVLLIDDVISTGATIEACTKLLRRAGIKQVSVASFARR